MLQITFALPAEISGVGLHSGLTSVMRFYPADPDTGIVFIRSDLSEKPEIPALYSSVVDTRNCTCIGDGKGNNVSTIEHLMSVLYILGIDNAKIEVSNPELPIMDGCAEELYKTLKKVPLLEQQSPKRFLKVLKTVHYADDKGNEITLAPSSNGLRINFEIDFPSPIIGHQEFHSKINESVFAVDIAPSRTFCEKSQIDYLRSIGLIKGGNLENALVIDGDTVLNKGGMRSPCECVNHKVLDAIGDMYTSGYCIIGELSASRTGHFHNNEILKILFSDDSNYELV